MRRVLLLSLLLLIGIGTQAQQQDKTRVLIILDCSHSMWDKWQSDSKIKVTQQVLLKFLDSVANQNNIDVALRVFGHLNKNAYGTRLEVPFEVDNKYKLQSKIKTLVPNGDCTAATALGNSLNDFPPSSASRNIILIITDGMDDCDASICEVARKVQMSGIIVQTFILGIGDKKDFQHSLDCAGKFIYVQGEEKYTETLYNIFHLSEEEAHVLVSVLDESGHLVEEVMPLAFYDAQTGVVKYSTLYSIDSRYSPDTLTVDPLVAYDITLFTTPPTVLKNKQFHAGNVNRLDISIEQGSLRLRTDGKRTAYQVPQYPVLVYKHNDNHLTNTQLLGEQHLYLAGFYDLEILSTPPVRLDNIAIVGSSATDLSIPTPGMANITKPKMVSSGTLFSVKDGILSHVCDLNPNKAVERLVLMPGLYQLVLKPQNSIDYNQVVSKRFQIESGQTTNINF